MAKQIVILLVAVVFATAAIADDSLVEFKVEGALRYLMLTGVAQSLKVRASGPRIRVTLEVDRYTSETSDAVWRAAEIASSYAPGVTRVVVMGNTARYSQIVCHVDARRGYAFAGTC